MDFDPHASTIESSFADDIVHDVHNLGIKEEASPNITCFSDVFNDIPIHFQIICFPKQIYAWIGCQTARFGCLYAAASTRPNNIVSVTSLLGGTSDNTGAGIARRIVLKTGVPVTLACNIPKDSPMLEAHVEKKLIQKLIILGYTKSKSQAVIS
ncbi:putative proteasome assembly chaperone 4 [Helianthus debilis subsp. tardiflorus]